MKNYFIFRLRNLLSHLKVKALTFCLVLEHILVWSSDLNKINSKTTDRSLYIKNSRSSLSEVFLGKDVLKICIKFTGEHTCQSAVSIKLLCNFIEIALRHGCSPVNLLYIFTTPFPKNTSEGLLPK